MRRKDTLGAEKGVFSLQSVPRCPFPQVKHGGPCGGFYFKFLLYFGHLLGCDSKLSKMQGKNSVAGAVIKIAVFSALAQWYRICLPMQEMWV